ncbi:MAG: hypothetical protein ACQGVC_21315 [Myxococcota bacterium]
MDTFLRTLSVAFGLVVVATFVLPEPADARSSRRRNYAEEWEREEREERYREEREQARREWQEHQKEQSERYYQHRERQLDKGMDRLGLTDPNAAPAAPRKKGGSCIYGEGDKILYQPAGVTCSR